jgi:hypothetical protein
MNAVKRMSDIWPAEDSRFRVDHGLLWAFNLVKRPQTTRYQLSTVGADVINFCIKHAM